MALEFLENPDERNDPPQPIIAHLIALRDMVVFAAVSWFIAAVVCTFFAPQILYWLVEPAKNILVVSQSAAAPAADGETTKTVAAVFQSLDMLGGISMAIKISMWGGLFLGFPFMIFAVLRFIFPALTNKEKMIIMSILFCGTILFLFGTWLAYAHTMPLAMNFFKTVNSWLDLEMQTIRIETYIPLVLKMILAFGVVFQLPLILFLLGWFGVISSDDLRSKRRVAIVLIFTVAMFLTPPDLFSQILMGIPLCLLYELAILGIWLKEKADRR